MKVNEELKNAITLVVDFVNQVNEDNANTIKDIVATSVKSHSLTRYENRLKDDLDYLEVG
jgi:hypothetical protein|tara:strand:- start:254 stop:433 length:180 start_codon:yes stop_codon:yes gene_type:complete